jgi:hypothetical protein
MRATTTRPQLALEWTDELRWADLPPAVQAELGQVLRRLLRGVVRADAHEEGGHDE